MKLGGSLVQPHQREHLLRLALWAGVWLLSLGVLAALSFWLRRLPGESGHATCSARLAADAEAPRLSASMGVAVFPLHGDSLEKLLGTADKLLYAVKKRQRRRGGRKTWKEAAA